MFKISEPSELNQFLQKTMPPAKQNVLYTSEQVRSDETSENPIPTKKFPADPQPNSKKSERIRIGTSSDDSIVIARLDL